MIRYRPPKKELRAFVRITRKVEPMSPGEFLLMRRATGLTQSEMAKRLGVSRLTICNWERGHFRIPVDIIEKLAKNVPAAKPSKAQTSLARETFEAYRQMRTAKRPYSHAEIVAMWQREGFYPCQEAQKAIAEAYPDILNPNQET